MDMQTAYDQLKSEFKKGYDIGYLDEDGFILDNIPMGTFNELRKSGMLKKVDGEYRLTAPLSKMNAKVGDRIRIDNMDGEPQYTGKEGVVEHIDDIGQIHGTWGGLAINPEIDEYTIL